MAALAVLTSATINASAVPLAFISPYGESLQMTRGQKVDVIWSTPFELTTVSLWQGPLEDGSWMSDVVAANWSQEERQLSWTAQALSGVDLSYGFHFQLQRGDGANDCSGCKANSATFEVKDSDASQISPSVSVVSTATMTTFSTSTGTSITPGVNAPSAASTTSVVPPPAIGRPPNTAGYIAIGVGVGAGVFLLAIAAGYGIIRRRKNQRQSTGLGTEQREMVRLHGAGMTTSKKSERYDPALTPRPAQ